jgi:thiosulfate dehydrogenase
MVDTLEERINGCMQRSMNGHALLLESREMRAFFFVHAVAVYGRS